MNFLSIRPLTADLLPAAHHLDRTCLGGMWTIDGYQRELVSPNSDLLGAQSPQQSILLGIGCLWAILEEAHITLLAVAPDYQRQGIGQALLYTLLFRAWQRGLEWATLEVRASNQAALGLYQQFGFQRVGERRRYYQDTGEDALVLWRSKLQAPEFPQTLTAWQQQIETRLERSGWRWLNTAQFAEEPSVASP